MQKSVYSQVEMIGDRRFRRKNVQNKISKHDFLNLYVELVRLSTKLVRLSKKRDFLWVFGARLGPGGIGAGAGGNSRAGGY